MKNNIIFFDSSYPPPIKGGKEKQAHNLALMLQKKNFKVIALTTNNNFSLSFSRYQGILRISVPYILLPLNILVLRLFSNIIHIHTPSRIGFLVLNLSYFLRFKILFKIPNMNIVGLNQNRDIQLLKKSNSIICLEKFSYNSLQLIKEKNNLKSAEIELLSNMVYLQNYSYKDIKKKINLVYSSRFVEQKRPIDFLKLSIKLKEKGINHQNHLLGDGPLFNELVKFAKDNDIYKYCEFYGMVEDPIKIISKGNCFISTSSKEGMSNSILESMSCGIPVIATNIGSSDVLLGKYFNEFSYSPGDINYLYKRILFLYKNIDIGRKYSFYLHNRAKAIFGPDIIAKNYEKIYIKYLIMSKKSN